jgi:T5SS/PEP-CTERM-associated repeat protein
MTKLLGLIFVIGVQFAFFPLWGSAAVTWIAPGDGLWSVGANWSSGVPPSANTSVLINNTNVETITIDASAAPANLTVQSLTLSAPAGDTNTLYLNNVASGPLTCTVGFEMQDGAVVQLTNSSLVLELTNDHVNIDGRLELDSGSIDFGDTTVTSRVGRVTSGTFIINSGTVKAGAVTVGGLTNSSGAINMNGGVFNISSMFSIGKQPGTTGSVLVAGGQVYDTNLDTRIGETGTGTMTVSNATVLLTNAAVGHDAQSSGTLNVQNGALVTFLGDVSVAQLPGSTGAVFVTGGQINAGLRQINLGKEGSGQMTISGGTAQAGSFRISADPTNTGSGALNISGGNLNLSGDLTVGSVTNSAGQISITGGSITITNSGSNGVVTVPNGSVTFNSGSITTDNLTLTNSTGQFVFNGGSLFTKNTVINNGAAFVVGNGVTAATLYLNGGVHSFANGLVISAHATLAGCGTIIGSVTMNGTNAINCNSLVAPRISSVVKTGVTNTISLASVTNQTYTLQYSTNLAATNWTSIPPPLSGNGGVLHLIDSTATNGSRFYRVLTQ